MTTMYRNSSCGCPSVRSVLLFFGLRVLLFVEDAEFAQSSSSFEKLRIFHDIIPHNYSDNQRGTADNFPKIVLGSILILTTIYVTKT